MDFFKGNEEKIREIYQGTPGARAAFSFPPPSTPVHAMPGGDYTLSGRPIEDIAAVAAADYQRWVEFSEALGDDSVPCASLMTGTHIYAAAFGCRTHVPDNDSPCALPMVFSAADAENIRVPDISASPTLARIFLLADALRRELGDDIRLGVPDMQSGFDTTCLIWDKADLYCAMADPDTADLVKRVNGQTARLFKEFLTTFRAANPNSSPCHCPHSWCPPELGPWLSNDECGIMGVEMFEEFCLPELVDLAETFGGLGMHCCADAEHQFESFRKIPNFYAFNRVCGKLRGQGFDPSVKILGGAGGVVHVLAWLSDEEAMRLMREHPDSRFIFVLDYGDGDIGETRRRLDTLRQCAADSA